MATLPGFPPMDKIAMIEGRPYNVDPTAKTGDLLTSYYLFDTNSFYRFAIGNGVLHQQLEKIKLEVAHQTGRRITQMLTDGRQYQITNGPVEYIPVGSNGGRFYIPGESQTIVRSSILYQTVRSLLLDQFSAEIGDYAITNRNYNSYDTEAVLNKKTNEIYYFAPAVRISHGVVQRVASLRAGATVDLNDIEIEDAKLVVAAADIEIEG